MFKNLLMGSAALTISAFALAGTAHALLIDDFIDAPQGIRIVGPEADPGGSDPATTLLDNAGGLAATDAGPHSTILGGYRDITTTLIGSPSILRATSSDAAIVDGTFSHSQDTGVHSNSYITWDGLGGAGLGSADLTDGGASVQFHLVVVTADDSALWSLQLFDSDSNDTYTFSNPSDVNEITVPLDAYLPFALFAGIDFTDIQKIVFGANIDSHVDFDTAVGLLETVGVPEPASMTLLGAGIMGMGYFGKRRARKANA